MWTYRYLRLRYVDVLGNTNGGIEFGVRFNSREQFRHDTPQFIALAFHVGAREYVFDLGGGKRRGLVR